MLNKNSNLPLSYSVYNLIHLDEARAWVFCGLDETRARVFCGLDEVRDKVFCDLDGARD